MADDDELRSAWQALAKTERLNLALLQSAAMGDARSVLAREGRRFAAEISLNVAGVVLLGWYAASASSAWLMGSAGCCMAFLIALNIALIKHRLALRCVDFNEPVVAVQTQLARLERRSAALVAVVLAAAPLIWVPASVVLASLIGVDLVHGALSWLIANLAFGVGALGAAILGARYLQHTGRQSAIVRVLSGTAYRDAAQHVDDLLRYTAE